MKRLFTNDIFYAAVTWIAIIGTPIGIVMNILRVPEPYMYCLLDALCAACMLCLYISYRKHNKNVMKGMMGALLMVILIRSANASSAVYTEGFIEMVIANAATILAALLFTNHFVINCSRKTSPWQIKINQIIISLMTIAILLAAISMILSESSGKMKMADIIMAVFSVCTMASVVCVESRLDSYRLDRETAGWTEEKGYPEGYVHEYEKK